MKPITALSLFNGISGLHLALDRAEIPINKVYYSEIDKFANQVTEYHYPNDIALGDVTKWKDWDIDWSSIDIVSAGFPCQAWSVAGKQLGDKDERGMLFWTTLDIIKKVLDSNPNAKFLMENVKMKKEFEEYITYHTEQSLGYVEKILINSALVSAQNRNRYYWTNFKVSELPKDKGVNIKEIIEFYKNFDVLTCEGIKPSVVKNIEQQHQQILNSKNRTFNLKCKSGYQDNIIGIEKTATLRAGNYCTFIKVSNNYYRLITPMEAERLQNVPDNFTSMLSKTQRYKCLGNGWTIDVIAHILKYAFEK